MTPSNHGWKGRITWDDYLAGYDGRPSFTYAQKAAATLQKTVYGDDFGAAYTCAADPGIRYYGEH